MDTFFSELWMILTESSIWLIVGFAIAGIVHALIPREWMLRHLSGRGVWPIAKASMLGIPLPLCSCAVIPVAAGLRKEGASKGASAAFAISTPQTGEESIPITWALFGPVYAFTRPVVAVITGLIAGVLIDLTTKRDDAPSAPEEIEPDAGAISLSITNADDAGKAVESVESRATTTGSCCSSKTPEPASSCCASVSSEPSGSCCASEPPASHTSVSEKLGSALTHGFKTMPIDLAIWLSIGILLAAVIGAFVPESFFTEYAGDGIGAKFVMLFVGIPLYICATSSTPLAWSLVAAGLSPGAALVMLLSGPATNVATMSWIIKDLGMKALVIYLGVIAAVALSAGILFDAMLSRFVQIADAADLHNHGGSFGIKEIAAILFIVLMAWALGMKMRAYMNAKGWGSTAPAPAAGSCCSSKPTEPSCGSSKA
jgi:uncharacterized membrane protein YraQ (UPF0718 family)